jgi:hypothetical protein
MLIQGSVGQEVRNLQTALNYHLPDARPKLVVDGVFGTNTLQRVAMFQDIYDIPKPRGVVGPRTHRALYSFVVFTHHIVFDAPRRYWHPGVQSIRAGSDNPAPSILPEIPPMNLRFPQPFSLPPQITPRLELDPSLLFSRTKFELESGQQRSFHTTLGSSKPERELSLFTDLKAIVWSQPLSENLEISAGGGFMLEKRIHSADNAQASVYIFMKAEVHDVLKIGHLDLAKLEFEAQLAPGPLDMSANVTFGPEVDVFDNTITFGPGVYGEIARNSGMLNVKGGVKLSGTWHF